MLAIPYNYYGNYNYRIFAERTDAYEITIAYEGIVKAKFNTMIEKSITSPVPTNPLVDR